MRRDGAEHACLVEHGLEGGAVVDAAPKASCGVSDVHRVGHHRHVHDHGRHMTEGPTFLNDKPLVQLASFSASLEGWAKAKRKHAGPNEDP